MKFVYFDPTTEIDIEFTTTEKAEELQPSAVPAASASVPEPSEVLTFATSTDARFYLSEDTGHFQADMLLSVRNILLLWFLCWAVFKMNNKIHNGVKAMLGRSDKH